MLDKVNENDASTIELRRRNLKAADLLEQWLREADEEDEQMDWPALENEIQKSDLEFFEPEDP